jgi:hypothetical protein
MAPTRWGNDERADAALAAGRGVAESGAAAASVATTLHWAAAPHLDTPFAAAQCTGLPPGPSKMLADHGLIEDVVAGRWCEAR